MRIKDQYIMNNRLGIPTSTNPFDFLLFDDSTGNLFCLELKSTAYKSISFQLTPDDTDGMVHAHQIKGLLDAQLDYKHIHSGFLFQFRETQTVYYMDINDFLRFASEVDRKSITPLYIVQYGGKVIESKKLRTHYLFNIKQIVDEPRKEDA